MDPATLDPWLKLLGPAGALLALVGYIYRKDITKFTDDWRGQSQMVMQVVKENTAASVRMEESQRAHTAAIAQHADAVRSLQMYLMDERRERGSGK